MISVNEVRGLIKLYGLKTEALKGVLVDNQVKPGWKTSEFWLTVLAQAPAIVGLFIGASNPITIGLGAAVTIAYTISRSAHKSAVGTAAAVAAVQAAADAAKAADAAPAA